MNATTRRGADKVSRFYCTKCLKPFGPGAIRFRLSLIDPLGQGMPSQHGKAVALLCEDCGKQVAR